ncbi:RagB/SusD family nutrient uptake outer membrane protein [Olivibacter sp. SDN3]|uniref:RagB/SusD family nutrient uptake outer membrane protein n=1 Tax=Olivibacter sp. SDN3 TaxID=2764720 RepID=UPI0016515738|nr:RagB/SusD family nutrient uptake outer membrane protein [Olivibacter sp. SDN3]QNL50591.1 RagB/SusD family nutrient uptake outer membrane protein [Olivibacter sp. SDN3]
MKKQFKNIIYIGLSGLLLFATSCKREFLDPRPLSFYTPEQTFSSAEGLWATLVACERNMRIETHGDGAPLLTEMVYSDIAVSGSTDKPGPAIDLNLVIRPDANLDNIEFENRIGWFWREGYRAIRYANTTITYIDLPEDYASEEEKNQLLGSAYFYRAYRYYRLTQQFGDIPLILEEPQEPKLDYYSTKREVILQKMKEDLEFAQEWVPDGGVKGRVTKGAVSHLLTKVNLALGLFDDAIQSASNVIDGGTYALMTERFGAYASDATRNIVWDLHRPENKSLSANREALMLVIDRINIDGNVSGGTRSMRNALPNWGNTGNVTPAGNRATSDQPGAEIDQVTAYGRGIARVRPVWHTQKTVWTDDTDLRHAPGNWMDMEDLVYNAPSLKGTDPYYGQSMQFRNDRGTILTNDTIRNWFSWPHYKLYVEDPQRIPADGGNSDWYVFRVAETFLLRAEAHFWKGDLASAAADINAVRNRAQATPITAADVNMGMILDERTRELYYEEPRKSELTRIAYIFAMTGKVAESGKSYSMETFAQDNYFYDRVMAVSDFYNKGVRTNFGVPYTMSPYHVLWPVPIGAINGNTQGVINQNEGYSGFENNVPALTEIIEEPIPFD